MQTPAGPVTVRGLSRREFVHLTSFGRDVDRAETFLLACGTGYSEEEVAKWRDASSPDAVGLVVDRISELSSLSEGARKSEPAGVDGRGGDG